ncbi:MAG: hypothetical protein J6Z11_05890 [Candidatus Riflebacteria bacterium]|nr:hypothetical protein [Candidatus Riflebacteria bacterium]
MKKIFVFLLILMLYCLPSYAQIWEGNGGQAIDEGIGFGSGSGGYDFSNYDGETIDITFTNNVDANSFTVNNFPAGFPFSLLMDSIPASYLEKTGYTLNGVNNQPVVLPDEDVSYVLNYSANQYTIQYWSDINTDYATQTVAFNSIITPPADPTYTAPNDFFYEWNNLPVRMPAQDLVIYADHGDDYYGFTLNASTGEIAYLADAVGKNPVSVNQSTVSNWSSNDNTSWKDFVYRIARPCMLKSDGTVDYYLDRDNQTLKEDGTASDINNFSYDGNAMVELKKVYISVSMDNEGIITCYLCRGQRDNSYSAEAFKRADGTYADRIYVGMFKGLLDSKNPQALRSISSTNSSPSISTNPSSIISVNIAANGTGWSEISYSIVNYINILHLLVGKNINVQAVYGGGLCGAVSGSIYSEGDLSNYGCFYGLATDSTKANGVAGQVPEFHEKVKSFWLADYWGNNMTYVQGINGLSSNNTVFLKTHPPYIIPNTTSSNSLDSTYDSYQSQNNYYFTVFHNCIIPTQKTNGPGGYPQNINSPICDYGSWVNSSSTTYAHYCLSSPPTNNGAMAGLYGYWFYYSLSGNSFISYRLVYLPQTTQSAQSGESSPDTGDEPYNPDPYDPDPYDDQGNPLPDHEFETGED